MRLERNVVRFCCPVKSVSNLYPPHGFIVTQQDTWQARNGEEEEGRSSEGGREAEKVEEERRI